MLLLELVDTDTFRAERFMACAAAATLGTLLQPLAYIGLPALGLRILPLPRHVLHSDMTNSFFFWDEEYTNYMQETIVFGGGCFWCTEAVFLMIKGGQSVEPGYTGGNTVDPTDTDVYTGKTGHAEVVKIEYNPDQISLEELLQVFFSTHDGTQLNRQGPDVGTMYRSAIFYTTERQREKARHYIDVLNKNVTQRIVTEVVPLDKFYPAQDYHKNFYKSGNRPDYCELVIDPKVDKVKNKFKSLLK